MLVSLAIAAAVLVVALAAALWVPLDLVFAARRQREFSFEMHVSWLGGLATADLGGRSAKRPESAVATVEEEPPRPRARHHGSRAMRMARSEGFVRGIVRLVRRVFAGLQVSDVALWIRVGLDDPADTGRLYGCLYPFSRVLSGIVHSDIDLRPDFSGAHLTFDGHARVRLVPARVLGPAVAFTFSRPTLRAIWMART